MYKREIASYTVRIKTLLERKIEVLLKCQQQKHISALLSFIFF